MQDPFVTSIMVELMGRFCVELYLRLNCKRQHLRIASPIYWNLKLLQRHDEQRIKAHRRCQGFRKLLESTLVHIPQASQSATLRDLILLILLLLVW